MEALDGNESITVSQNVVKMRFSVTSPLEPTFKRASSEQQEFKVALLEPSREARLVQVAQAVCPTRTGASLEKVETL